MSNEAIILAGGMGTRLQSVVSDVPKPMAPVNGKPFLFYLLNYLNSEGITRVIFSVGYKHEIISSYFGNRFKNIEIIYSIEDQPLGTGGAIWLALQKCTQKHLIILNGDTFFPVPLHALKKIHAAKKAETTIALKKIDDAARYGTVCLSEDSFISSFKEKNEASEALINGGIYCLNKPAFLKRNFSQKFSFEKDYLETRVSNRIFAGHVFNSYFLDIGIPDSLKKAGEDFTSIFDNEGNLI